MNRDRARKQNENLPVAIVTGGGRRLGRYIALALGAHSYRVIVNYNDSREGAHETVSRLRKGGVESHAIRANISRPPEVSALVQKTLDLFGTLDLLVNNSAVFIDSPLLRTTERLWDTTININLKGSFLCSQAVAPFMLKQKSGKIINIASLGGIQAWARHLPYSVSKAGVIMLTRCLAKELAPHIQVNAVAPGTIIMEGEEVSGRRHVPVSSIPLQRYGKPSDITDLVVFLATTASYMTGQVLVADGGRSIP